MSEAEMKAIKYLKELSKCELFLDNILIKDKTARQIIISAYNKLERQQKEIEREKQYTDFYKDLCNKQQKEIKDWFEIADNILRATNDYGNITIGDIPKYIENQQKEIKKEKSRIMELDELLDKQENEIKFLKGELEIQEGCSISKDKIREKIDKYRKKSEKLHSQELWNEPEDSIKDFKYNHYLEAYKELLGEPV